MIMSAKRKTLMSDSMACANSRASMRSTGFSVIIPPVKIDFGGGTGVHEVPVDFYEGGPRGHGGSDPLGGRRSKMGYAILLMTVPWPKPFKFKAQPDPQWLCSLQTSFLHFSIGSFDML